MNYLDTDIVAEVRQNRERLLARYGGLDGLHKHMKAERPSLERLGWQFISLATIREKQKSNQRLHPTPLTRRG